MGGKGGGADKIIGKTRAEDVTEEEEEERGPNEVRGGAEVKTAKPKDRGSGRTINVKCGDQGND